MISGNIRTLDDLDVKGKTILLRCDINCPVDEKKVIKNTKRIRSSAPTIKELSQKGAKVVVLAHQGDPLDYQNFTSLREHRDYLVKYLECEVDFVEDIAGPAARATIRSMQSGEILLLENIRLYTEETIIFEKEVRLSPQDQCHTYLVRQLAPLADYYVCDAFACVHRSEPSLVAFPQLLPSAAGRLFETELTSLMKVRFAPQRPCLYLLGGAKILDAFHMMQQVLKEGAADRILTFGLVSNIMLKARGYDLGPQNEAFLEKKNLLEFVEPAVRMLDEFGEKIAIPEDVAVNHDGQRQEIDVAQLPVDAQILDIGQKTIDSYLAAIQSAQTIFLNGPAGAYEQAAFANGTARIWQGIAESDTFSVIGGGDTIMAAAQFGVEDKVTYVCTAGGGLIRFLSGEVLPVIEALKNR